MQHNPIQIPSPEALAAVPTAIIAGAIDQLIEVLDSRDGDPDLEDSEAGESCVNERGTWLRKDEGPGCHATDADFASWPERTNQTRFPRAVEPGVPVHEDDEDDDPREVTHRELWCGESQEWLRAGFRTPDDAEDDDPGGGDVQDERHDAAIWPERIDQSRFPPELNGRPWEHVHEDEEDGGDAEPTGDEGEPDFRRRAKSRAGGAGCMISDPDYGHEEAGEPEHDL